MDNSEKQLEELILQLRNSRYFKQSSLNGEPIFRLTKEGKLTWKKIKIENIIPTSDSSSDSTN